MAGAATIVAGTSGIRLWLTARVWVWLTPSRLRHATRGLLVTAVVASGLLVTGSGSSPTEPARGVLQRHAPATNTAPEAAINRPER